MKQIGIHLMNSCTCTLFMCSGKWTCRKLWHKKLVTMFKPFNSSVLTLSITAYYS